MTSAHRVLLAGAMLIGTSLSAEAQGTYAPTARSGYGSSNSNTSNAFHPSSTPSSLPPRPREIWEPGKDARKARWGCRHNCRERWEFLASSSASYLLTSFSGGSGAVQNRKTTGRRWLKRTNVCSEADPCGSLKDVPDALMSFRLHRNLLDRRGRGPGQAASR